MNHPISRRGPGRQPASNWERPPLWLAAAAVAAGWGAIYSIGRWILSFVVAPIHEDVRIWYVAAEAGVRYGWSTIYDVPTLLSLSRSFPPREQKIDSAFNFVNPPLLAWLFAPLTVFSEPVAYGLWSLISLGALAWAWHIAAPYKGLAKFTLLLLALAIWPVLACFYFGQPTILVMALVATAWWLCAKDRPVSAGIALAVATGLKPHVIFLIPVALGVSGRYRPVIAWIAGSAVLGVASIVALGVPGLTSWWEALKYLQSDPSHAYVTLVYVTGTGPLTYVLWAVQGVAALAVARWRRAELEMVFAAGLLGSVAAAFHFHEADYSMLVLAGWLVLRTAPPLWHRVWLLVGVATLQTVTFGPPTPQLIWDAAWLAILVVTSLHRTGAPEPATRPERVVVADAPT